jgi:hypothetical protein
MYPLRDQSQIRGNPIDQRVDCLFPCFPSSSSPPLYHNCLLGNWGANAIQSSLTMTPNIFSSRSSFISSPSSERFFYQTLIKYFPILYQIYIDLQSKLWAVGRDGETQLKGRSKAMESDRLYDCMFYKVTHMSLSKLRNFSEFLFPHL